MSLLQSFGVDLSSLQSSLACRFIFTSELPRVSIYSVLIFSSIHCRKNMVRANTVYVSLELHLGDP